MTLGTIGAARLTELTGGLMHDVSVDVRINRHVAEAGVAIVIVGLVMRQPLIGILGFVVMLAGVLFALRPGMRAPKAKAPRAGKPSTGGASRPSQGGGGSFMDRMNDRWDKRNDNQG